MAKEPDKNDEPLTDRVDKLRKKRAEKEIFQLPIWFDNKRGTPNSFIRSALFSAVQSKDREYMQGKVLFSQEGITVKYTGQQLNQEDLTLWETLVDMAKTQPLGHICTFTAYGILKKQGIGTGGDQHERL